MVDSCPKYVMLSHIRVYFPLLHRALQDTYLALADPTGTTTAMADRLMTFAEFNKLIGMEACLAAEERLTRREGDKLTVRVRGQTKKV